MALMDSLCTHARCIRIRAPLKPADLRSDRRDRTKDDRRRGSGRSNWRPRWCRQHLGFPLERRPEIYAGLAGLAASRAFTRPEAISGRRAVTKHAGGSTRDAGDLSAALGRTSGRLESVSMGPKRCCVCWAGTLRSVHGVVLGCAVRCARPAIGTTCVAPGTHDLVPGSSTRSLCIRAARTCGFRCSRAQSSER